MVLARKGVFLALFVLASLILVSPMVMVNASKTTNDFYLKMYPTTVNVDWQHWADNKLVIFHLTEGGIVNNYQNVTVGTITIDVVTEVLNPEAQIGTVVGKYEINFDSGEIIKGTITGKVQNPSLPDVQLDAKFVGHGDMNVMGEASIINEGTHGKPIMVSIFDGYSW